jgi:hypothetical protein
LSAQDFTVPDKPHVRVVCKLENMLRAPKDAHEPRSLLEQDFQAVGFMMAAQYFAGKAFIHAF